MAAPFDAGARYQWRNGENGATTREGVLRPSPKVRKLMVRERFNSGPTPRHAILDFIRLLDEHPEVWSRIAD